MDITKTENYYKTLNNDSLCSCDYCKNYYKEVKTTYPELSDHLAGMGVDIEKPFETMPLGPYERTIEMGCIGKFQFLKMNRGHDEAKIRH